MDARLFYVRHSITDGPDLSPKEADLACVADYRNLGPGGIALAEEKGQKTVRFKVQISHLFYGALARTAQTALAFCRGLGYVPELHPVVAEIWDDSAYRSIDTPAYRNLVREGAPKFQAVVELCTRTQVTGFSGYALQGVRRMLALMKSGEVGIAFGHDPIIGLAAYALSSPLVRVMASDPLAEFEGFVFSLDQRTGEISVVGNKISL